MGGARRKTHTSQTRLGNLRCVLAALGAAKDLRQQLAVQSVLSQLYVSARRHTHGAHSCIVSLLPPSLGSDLWLCDLLPAPSEKEERSGKGKNERKQNRDRTAAEVNFSQVCDKVYMIRVGLVGVCAVI